MNDARPLDGRGWAWLQSTRLALLLLVLQPLVIKAPLLLGILKSNPLLKYSGLASPSYVGMPGVTTIDPNIAFTSHALGGYAANAFFRGESLWWNPYEGIGTPLVGEMQSAALFPPTWLLALPNGQLLEHLLFQIIAGVATFFFLRRLNASVVASWFAGTLFAFNGAFAWLANAAINPICFLPVVMLGVELVRSTTFRDRAVGSLCVSLGLAASLYSGFPETAYLDGLMIGGWVVLRSFSTFSAWRPRTAFLARSALLALCGFLMAMPLLVAFGDYLMVANIGLHGSEGIANALHPSYVAMFLLPYLSGALSHSPTDFWGGIGGYAGVALAVLAVAGATGAAQRGIRIYLMAWTVVGIGLIFGLKPVIAVVRLIPALSSAALYRYIEPSVLFAMAILAALFIDELTVGAVALRRFRLILIATLIVTVGLAAIAIAGGASPLTTLEYLPLTVQIGLIAIIATVTFVGGINESYRRLLLAIVTLAEAVALFMVPMISYPLQRQIHLGSVGFLQQNLGNQRFVAAGQIGIPGTIAANYGSFFEIGQINWNDLPVPQLWVDYVAKHIKQSGDAIILRVSPQQVLADITAYAAMGTKYITVSSDVRMNGLPEVYADPVVRIYQIPGVRPYFTAAGCTMSSVSRTMVTTYCARPSQLRRLELFMPGWMASVNGRSTTVTQVDEAFQAVQVPAGIGRVVFAFEPPYLLLGQILSLLGIAMLTAIILFDRRRNRIVTTAS